MSPTCCPALLFAALQSHCACAGVKHRLPLMNVEVHFYLILLSFIGMFSVFYLFLHFTCSWFLHARCMLITQYVHKTCKLKKRETNTTQPEKMFYFNFLVCCFLKWNEICHVCSDGRRHCPKKLRISPGQGFTHQFCTYTPFPHRRRFSSLGFPSRRSSFELRSKEDHAVAFGDEGGKQLFN